MPPIDMRELKGGDIKQPVSICQSIPSQFVTLITSYINSPTKRRTYNREKKKGSSLSGLDRFFPAIRQLQGQPLLRGQLSQIFSTYK